MAGATRQYVPEMQPKFETFAPFPASSEDSPLDAFMVGAGVTSIIAARNLALKNLNCESPKSFASISNDRD